ncbi:hypothetical protein CEUSTIGMA_g3156.t1 [Chlamydomonas eustigma]|uniref:Amino acid transporter transmembrane domain-containing protein n=1 Tax=Chlamydomonas eustigma TaxID=1157962 RepID=A0A250WXZ7_9CHLO|nr:hypothetical protein CEUSTIGMA_g3156.t1 [Chlamydomonas eustigma]|eukprot:GAX75713.1 hypothetical protein CEUSTIGMA_g3156.t1 [Chlamydomonas eustigma]
MELLLQSQFLQTTSALLALQLGLGLWLFPADFASLGWYTSAGCFVVLAALAAYSGFLFSRLYRATPGAVLFGDIGFKAAGHLGRNIVYMVIYSLDATQCVIIHLAATQALRHTFPEESAPPLWKCGAAVWVVACIFAQIHSLPELSWVFMTGTTAQLITIGIVLYELVMDPDPDAHHTNQAVSFDTLAPASVAVMNMIYAFGGQFAFVEIMSSMKKPSQFPFAVNVCTALMSVLYATMGIIGYWSRGCSLSGIVIFSLGHSPRIRFAAGLVLVQVTSQYMINLNVWTHNLLTLSSRGGSGKSHIRSSADHGALKWLLTSVFVVTYSYLISTSVPHFSSLVSLVTSATFLISTFALPAWFTLSLIGEELGWVERIVMWSLIPLSFVFSGIGMYGSVVSLVENIGAGGWS